MRCSRILRIVSAASLPRRAAGSPHRVTTDFPLRLETSPGELRRRRNPRGRPTSRNRRRGRRRTRNARFAPQVVEGPGARQRATSKADKPSVTLSPWSAAGALAVVVGLILVLARLFRRHAPMFSQSLPQEALEILGRRFVDPRQAILLVRIGARILVVGSSANGLNPLGQIDDPVEVDLLAGLCRRGPHAGRSRDLVFQAAQRRSEGTAGAQRRSLVHERAPGLGARSDGRLPVSFATAGTAGGRSVAARIRFDAAAPRRAPAPLHADRTDGVR